VWFLYRLTCILLLLLHLFNGLFQENLGKPALDFTGARDDGVAVLCCVDNLDEFMCSVWSLKTGELLNTLIHHCEAVLHLRFNDGIMVTCSKVKLISS